jgi:ketosteroid isomerase-like protein
MVRDISTSLDMTKRSFRFVILALAFLGSTSFAADSKSEIRAVLEAQQNAWNRGDIDAFMDGYWRSDETVFVSGDDVLRSWQKVLERYKRQYSDRKKMGILTFPELEITSLSGDSAVVLGSWRLGRVKDQPHGRFTLIFRRFDDSWKIIHDHTSAAETK